MDRQVSIRLRESQFERLLDLAFLGAKIYNRCKDADPDEVKADNAVYEAFKQQCVTHGIVADTPNETHLPTLQQPQERRI